MRPNVEHEYQPVVFGKGPSKVTLYTAHKRKYPHYIVCFRVNGRRTRITRSYKPDAVEYAEEMSKFLANGDKPFVLRKARSSAFEVMPVPESLFHIAGDLKAFHLVRIPCIYFLVRGKDVVYVGKSTNLVKRLGKHLESKLFDSVFYLPVVTVDLDAVEKRHIRLLDPIYNRTASPFDWASNRAARPAPSGPAPAPGAGDDN